MLRKSSQINAGSIFGNGRRDRTIIPADPRYIRCVKEGFQCNGSLSGVLLRVIFSALLRIVGVWKLDIFESPKT